MQFKVLLLGVLPDRAMSVFKVLLLGVLGNGAFLPIFRRKSLQEKVCVGRKGCVDTGAIFQVCNENFQICNQVDRKIQANS